MTETVLAELALLGVEPPPSQEELPYDDGVPMETQRHKLQIDLLTEPLWLRWAKRQDFFVAVATCSSTTAWTKPATKISRDPMCLWCWMYRGVSAKVEWSGRRVKDRMW